MRELNTSHKWQQKTLNAQIPQNPCKGSLLTGVTSTTRYCHPTKVLMARRSCQFVGGLSFIEQFPSKFTVPAINTETTFFSSPQYQVSTFEIFKTDQRTSPEPLRTYRNVESRATSVISAKCGSPVKPVQEGRNGPVHFMPNLICLTLNSSINKILILMFPGGFQPEMRGVGHTAPHIRTIFAAGKSRRPQILRENC